MSTQIGKWREEQILIICPGSLTTMAQMGCSELTPPFRRFPTRMFKDEDTDDWMPYHTYKRKKVRPAGAANGYAVAAAREQDEWEYVEDQDSNQGAVYPMQGGRITNMVAFLAFLEHVHSSLVTTYHNTPIMMMASPQWTRGDCEAITQYIFEKTRTPALCLIHSGVATQYGLKWPHMTVVDIGFEKADVTCIYDSRVVNHVDIGARVDGGAHRNISGGEVFTQKLMGLLKDRDFTHEMAEQLKKSTICEVLPYAPDHPGMMELPDHGGPPSSTIPPPSAVLQSASDAGPRIVEPQQHLGGVVDDEGTNGEDRAVDSDGVLDVAAIVTSGQTKEFLAKKEKEKVEKSKVSKRARDKEAEAAAARPSRLPNTKRVRNVFHYEEFVREETIRSLEGSGSKDQEMREDVVVPGSAATDTVATDPAAMDTPATDTPATDVAATDAAATDDAAAAAVADTKEAGGAGAEGVKMEEAQANDSPANGEAPPKPEQQPLSFFPSAEPAQAPAPAASAPEPEGQIKRVRRDMEIGLERFTFADRAEIDRIVTAIYRAVQGIEDMYMRPPCWENIVFVGNGCRVRGLKDNIMQTLTARHLISPSTATMFTSELPSNLATPSGTGAQTPTGSFTALPHQLPTSSSVNPLLQAATTASLALPAANAGIPGAPSSNAGDTGAPSHHFHSQTPTTIKLTTLPTYLSDWTKNGFEEGMFLGAQVAARLAFCMHNLDIHGIESQRLMSLSRVDYNELGPKAIRSHSMLG